MTAKEIDKLKKKKILALGMSLTLALGVTTGYAATNSYTNSRTFSDKVLPANYHAKGAKAQLRAENLDNSYNVFIDPKVSGKVWFN